jgi:LPXTG-site transpeptidase (sortase) family protein
MKLLFMILNLYNSANVVFWAILLLIGFGALAAVLSFVVYLLGRKALVVLVSLFTFLTVLILSLGLMSFLSSQGQAQPQPGQRVYAQDEPAPLMTPNSLLPINTPLALANAPTPTAATAQLALPFLGEIALPNWFVNLTEPTPAPAIPAAQNQATRTSVPAANLNGVVSLPVPNSTVAVANNGLPAANTGANTPTAVAVAARNTNNTAVPSATASGLSGALSFFGIDSGTQPTAQPNTNRNEPSGSLGQITTQIPQIIPVTGLGDGQVAGAALTVSTPFSTLMPTAVLIASNTGVSGQPSNGGNVVVALPPTATPPMATNAPSTSAELATAVPVVRVTLPSASPTRQSLPIPVVTQAAVAATSTPRPVAQINQPINAAVPTNTTSIPVAPLVVPTNTVALPTLPAATSTANTIRPTQSVFNTNTPQPIPTQIQQQPTQSVFNTNTPQPIPTQSQQQPTQIVVNTNTPQPIPTQSQQQPTQIVVNTNTPLPTYTALPSPTSTQMPLPSATATSSSTVLAPYSGKPQLVIPAISFAQDTSIVPLVGTQWDLNNLGSEVGWLEHTGRYPGDRFAMGFAGHVALSSTQNGPFYYLNKLQLGDTILYRADGKEYEYHIEQFEYVPPYAVEKLFVADGNMLILITCSGWNQQQSSYTTRLLVKSRLIATRTLP